MAGGADLVFGPVLIGVLLNCILYGILIVQTFVYFQSYKTKDAPWIQTFVWYLLACETLNTLCDIGVVCEPLIFRYGTPRVFIYTPIMLIADAVLMVMISTPVQLFIAWRLKIISKSMILPAIIGFFAITSCISGIATSVCVAIFKEYRFFSKYVGAITTWLACSAAADVIITTSLVYNLLSRRTGYAATDDLINRIIRLTVHTGLVTTIAALLDLIIPAALHPTTINLVWDFALSKLYSNSLLSTLNARQGWKATSSFRDNLLFGDVTDGENVTRNLPQMEFANVDAEAGYSTNKIPMNIFGSGGSYRDVSSSRITVTVSKNVVVDEI